LRLPYDVSPTAVRPVCCLLWLHNSWQCRAGGLEAFSNRVKRNGGWQGEGGGCLLMQGLRVCIWSHACSNASQRQGQVVGGVLGWTRVLMPPCAAWSAVCVSACRWLLDGKHAPHTHSGHEGAADGGDPSGYVCVGVGGMDAVVRDA